MKKHQAISLGLIVMLLFGCAQKDIYHLPQGPIIHVAKTRSETEHALKIYHQSHEALDRLLALDLMQKPLLFEKSHDLYTPVDEASLKMIYQLLQAKRALLRGKKRSARYALRQVQYSDSEYWSEQYWSLYALAFPIRSLQARIGMALTYPRMFQDDLVWEMLIEHPNLDHAASFQVQAWMDLAALVKSDDENRMAWSAGFASWCQTYPTHDLAKKVCSRGLILPPHIQKIGLMLPMQGSYADIGGAIQSGFFEAYYHAKRRDRLDIRTYDTTKMSLDEILKQANQDGIEVMVGPLRKEKLEKLIKMGGMDRPILALNSVVGLKGPHIYQLDYSPESQAEQAANRMAIDGLAHILLFYEPTPWGERMSRAFEEAWSKQGGVLLERLALPEDDQDLAEWVRQQLGVTDSLEHYRHLRHRLGHAMRFKARSRQDIEGAFLAMHVKRARQLVPLLRYHYGLWPLYGTDVLHPMHIHGKWDADLSGVRFLYEPWSLAWSEHSVKPNTYPIWPNTYRRINQYKAIGIDAFDLLFKLERLHALPFTWVKGAKGNLYLIHQRVLRVLPWAEYENKKVRHIPKVSTILQRPLWPQSN